MMILINLRHLGPHLLPITPFTCRTKQVPFGAYLNFPRLSFPLLPGSQFIYSSKWLNILKNPINWISLNMNSVCHIFAILKIPVCRNDHPWSMSTLAWLPFIDTRWQNLSDEMFLSIFNAQGWVTRGKSYISALLHPCAMKPWRHRLNPCTAPEAAGGRVCLRKAFCVRMSLICCLRYWCFLSE